MEQQKRKFGVLLRVQSFWVGVHYSKACKRYCLNPLPCLTIWWTTKGGKSAKRKLM